MPTPWRRGKVSGPRFWSPSSPHVEERSPDPVMCWCRAPPGIVVGSGIPYVDRGERQLEGVPGAWKLFTVGT